MKKAQSILIKLSSGLTVYFLGLAPNFTARAQITNPILEGESGTDAEGAASGSLLYSFISGLLAFMMLVGAMMVLINLIQAAIDWIGSGGDTGKIESARSRLTNAIIGFIILSASYAVWLVVKEFLGVNLTIERLFP